MDGKEGGVIRLTRMNETSIVVNVDLIKFVEETPDTILTLRDGEKVLVRESAEDVVERAIEYARATRFPPGF